MSVIKYCHATLSQLDFLVALRMKELSMFSDVPLEIENVHRMKAFYKRKMEQDSCYTILGYDGVKLVVTGTIYFYEAMPSNANHTGIVGVITNIWTDERYRGQGLASSVVKQLLDIAKGRCGQVCLHAATGAEGLYQRLGFIKNEKAMVYTWDQ